MCYDKSDWMGGLAPIGTVCVPSQSPWNFQGEGYNFGAQSPVNAYKMCLCEHEEDNARYGRVSKKSINYYKFF